MGWILLSVRFLKKYMIIQQYKHPVLQQEIKTNFTAAYGQLRERNNMASDTYPTINCLPW
jgi:hypothetical protein